MGDIIVEQLPDVMDQDEVIAVDSAHDAMLAVRLKRATVSGRSWLSKDKTLI